MKPFLDHEFRLVTQKSLPECLEMVRQIGLYAEMMGTKAKKKKTEDGAEDPRSFAYKYSRWFTQLSVFGTIEPYEQPYTGCRVPVFVTEGKDATIMKMFVMYLVMPLWFLGAMLEQDYDVATGLMVFAFLMFAKEVLCDMKAKKIAQDLLAQIFQATVEPPKKEIHEDA